jgi:hypothetical protein
MRAGVPWFVGLSVLLLGAELTASPVLATCGKDCRKLITTEFMACRTACGKDKVCKQACRDGKKADVATCTTLRCHFEAATNDCQGGCPLSGQRCTLVASAQCDCVPAACHTCWITVDDFCTSTLCSSDSDCTREPNLLCLPDKCDVPCPTVGAP